MHVILLLFCISDTQTLCWHVLVSCNVMIEFDIICVYLDSFYMLRTS